MNETALTFIAALAFIAVLLLGEWYKSAGNLQVACLHYAADINARAMEQGRTEPCPDPREAAALLGKGGAA